MGSIPRPNKGKYMKRSELRPYVVCDHVKGVEDGYMPILIECRLERDARKFGRCEQLTTFRRHIPQWELVEVHKLENGKIARLVVGRANRREYLERLRTFRNGRGTIERTNLGSSWNIIKG